MAVFDRNGVLRHQSLARDHLAYCDLTTDRQRRASDIVRAHHALVVSRVNRKTVASPTRFVQHLTVTDRWALVFNSASTIRQKVKTNTDPKVLKA